MSTGPVTLSGPAWTQAAAFRAMQVSERLGEPFFYELEVLSESANLDPTAVLGEALTVSLEVGADKRHFNAYPTRLVRLGTLGELFHYRLELRPWLWFLSKSRNARIFQRKSVPEIVKGILRDYGFTLLDERLSGSYPSHEFVVQYRESDLDFVRRLLEQEGIYFFFEHAASSHTLVLADSPSAHTPTPFYPALRFLPPDQHREAHLDHIESWESTSDIEPGAYALTDFDFEKPQAPLGVSKRAPAKHPQAEYEVFDYPGKYSEESEGNRLALMRLEALHAERTRSSGESNARGLLPGAQFTLQGHPVAEMNRDHLVVAMSASIRSHDLESGAELDADSVFRCQFTAIASSQQFRPQRVTPRPIVHGAQTATVVGKAGEEIWTDEYGRVKLRFHWDRQSSADEESSCWVRVAQAWAGSGFGGIHVPRIGQEVVVEFLEGDPDRPLVIGRVYNFDNMPPYGLPQSATQSGIKSRSTPDGFPDNANEIRFEDAKGAELFHMQAEKDHTTLVKNNQSTTVSADRSATVGGNDSLSVSKDRTLTVTGNMTVTVQGGQSTLSVTGKHDVSATDTIEVQAPTHILLSVGGSSISIEPTAITLRAGGGAALVLDENVLLQSRGGSSVLLDATAQVASNGKALMVLDRSATLRSAADSVAFLDADAIFTSKGSVTVSGKKVSLDGAAQGKLDLESSGATLAGPRVACSSSGVNEITGAVVKIN